ncbi:GPO family capsid scaffolding protein [Mitsuaria sp. GD03876]|uniref:GPO family capsid scaffolding protein n=1 Tax=Mitsuaria sp. GD03876 TaxID=2975399 RepID=UPI00244BF8DF|nr:GPO family capsid scaffolding protein [Mitsuaria sp. GD03876]MDH0866440.1 GPO family capsid scaffolding protein [Mitsuaria sp. GD03876]
MSIKSRKFRVATEGATTDGRTIQREWLVQAAKNYNPKTYGARVNLEHLRSVYPDSAFRAYGDIVSLETKEEDGKLRLYAEIKPLPELVALTKAGQKLFTSIEINPKFADTGEAYVVGVAVTDNPASLGTDMLSFAQQNPKASPFAARKSSPDALFTEAVETELAFEDEPDSEESRKFSERLRGLVKSFTSKGKSDDARFGELVEALEQITEHLSDQAEASAAHQRRADAAEKAFSSLKTEFDQVKATVAKFDTTPAPGFSQRPPATGSNPNAGAQTDC